MATPDVPLIVNAAISLLSAAIYGYVGRIVWSRPVPDEDARFACHMFAVWWISFAALLGVSSAITLLAAFQGPSLALMITYLYVAILVIVVALWALLYYLVYVYTGNRRWFAPITAGYVVLALVLVYAIAWLNPVSVSTSGLGLSLDYERELPRAATIILGLAISGPALAAAVLYGSLYFQATGRTEKFRIGLVSGSFVLWFGWSVLSTALQLNQRYPDSVALQVVGRTIGVLAAVVVLMAYRPPAFLRRRWHVRAADEAAE